MKNIAEVGYDTWMGEWSLATDTCAHWLGGFNDRQNDRAEMKCKQIECPESYMGDEFKAETTINKNPIGSDKMSHGPFSMTDAPDGYYHGRSIMLKEDGKNYCWTDSEFFKDDDVAVIANCTLNALNQYTSS